MKLTLFLCVATLLGAGGVVLAQALQAPDPGYSAAPTVAWSRPALVVDHGIQTRYALAPRGNQPAGHADVLVRFESIPDSTIQSLRQTYPRLNHSRPILTAARVTVDVLGDGLPGRTIKAQRALDGSGAFEARVIPPAGGWFHQTLRLGYEAYSGDRLLFSSDGVMTLAP
jgi:hypothetical protein